MSRTTFRRLNDGSSQPFRSLIPNRLRTPSPPQRSGFADWNKSPDRRGSAFPGVSPSDRSPYSKTTSAVTRPSSTTRRARKVARDTQGTHQVLVGDARRAGLLLASVQSGHEMQPGLPERCWRSQQTKKHTHIHTYVHTRVQYDRQTDRVTD